MSKRTEAKVTAQKTEVVKTEERNLPVKLTDEEKLAKGDELARAVKSLATHEGDEKEMRASMKERREEIERQIGEVARVVEMGAEYRPVWCDDVLDRERGIVETVRKDTGEVVGTRGMTANERQVELFPVTIVDERNKGDHS